MERRIGEQQPESSVVRCDGCGNAGIGTLRRDDNRTVRAGQSGAICGRKESYGRGVDEVRCHHGEWFITTAFSTAKKPDGVVVFSIAGKMKSAEPFNGYDFALMQATTDFAQDFEIIRVSDGFELGGVGARSGTRQVRVFKERQRRAAARAGIGLRMKTPVSRISVFALTLGAHLKSRHGGGQAVVRNVANYAVARAAVGAVGERVPVTPVGRGSDILQTIGTGGHVRGNERELAGFWLAVGDAEKVFAAGLGIGDFDRIDSRERRRRVGQALGKSGD